MQWASFCYMLFCNIIIILYCITYMLFCNMLYMTCASLYAQCFIQYALLLALGGKVKQCIERAFVLCFFLQYAVYDMHLFMHLYYGFFYPQQEGIEFNTAT